MRWPQSGAQGQVGGPIHPPLASPPFPTPTKCAAHLPYTHPKAWSDHGAALRPSGKARARGARGFHRPPSRARRAHFRNGPTLPPTPLGLMPHTIGTVERHASLSYPTGAATCSEDYSSVRPSPLGGPRSTRLAPRTESTHMEWQQGQHHASMYAPCMHRMPWDRRSLGDALQTTAGLLGRAGCEREAGGKGMSVRGLWRVRP